MKLTLRWFQFEFTFDDRGWSSVPEQYEIWRALTVETSDQMLTHLNPVDVALKAARAVLGEHIEVLERVEPDIELMPAGEES